MAIGSSMKDRLILSVAAVVALYAVGGWLWYSALLNRTSAWNSSRRQFKEAVTKVQKERKLIAERTKWIDRYDEEREKMPLFPEGEDVKTHWLRRMDALAEQNHVWIFSRDPGQEQQVGDVYEMPIDVKNWEGGLDPLVKFLYALEHAEGAMFDVQAIMMRPSSHKGALRGSFTLSCAYMRGDEAKE